MKRGMIKLVALGGALFAALFVFTCSDLYRPASPTHSGAAVLAPSAAAKTTASVPMPEIVVGEAELSPDAETLSEGDAPEGHVHAYHLISSRVSTCAASGEKLYCCACGMEKREVLPALSHAPTAATCAEPSLCSVCGAICAMPTGHAFPAGSDTCSRCGVTLNASFYVLGQELEFDESADAVRAKLGSPTEVIREGDLFTYVYAGDLRRLTFVQMDEGGIWGVYSFDPAQRMKWQGRGFDLGSFSGQRAGDDEWIAFGDVTAFGFRDNGTLYALWMRLDEYDYNYASDPAVYGKFSGQEKLSLYIANAMRRRAGVRTLSRSAAADAVAGEYCDYMITSGLFEHDYSFESRLRDHGVSWREAGENLSLGYTNCLFVLDAYLNSPDHRENLLNPVFTHVGLSYRKDGVCVYGAQEFYCL